MVKNKRPFFMLAANEQGLLAVVEFQRLLLGKLGEDNQGYVAQ